RLIRLVSHSEEPHMPSKAPKLSEEKIARIAAWIDAGAPYDKALIAKAEKKLRDKVTDEDRKFWSFQPLQKPSVPRVKNASWCRNDLDRFILAKLEEKKLKPNPAIERRKLIRRVYFDLIGLPPGPEEVDAFVNDKTANAYTRVIDHLLASPHYGERWARHWLDLARYADSEGFKSDETRPNIWRYRDYVIDSFNQDKPYDRFIKEQIAGDELYPNDPVALVATGFNRHFPDES